MELDFIRGIAILLVLGAHYTFPKTGWRPIDWIGQTANAVGSVGVDLFFVLSGFLVGGLLLREYKETGQLRPRRFLVRRAFKIWPALYVLILVHAVLGRHPLDTFFWQNLLHVQNYFGTSIAHTWSLAVEEHFYLLLALSLWGLVGKSPRFILLVLLGTSALVTVGRYFTVAAGHLEAAFLQTQNRIDGLIFGVVLALIFHFYPAQFERLSKWKWPMIAVTAALVVWIYWAAGNFQPSVYAMGFTVRALGFSILLVLVYSHSGRLTNHRWYRSIAWAGVYSYGIYLWHTVALTPGIQLIRILGEAGLNSGLIWVIAVAGQLALGILTGYVMTKLVEWPFLRLRERVFPQVTPISASK